MGGFSLAFHLADLRLIAASVLATFAIACELGWRVGRRRGKQDETFRALVGGVAAATLALLGLLLGFTLSTALERYEVRRAVITGEANAIGTLWLRAGLLDEPLATELRGTLRDYADARLDLGRIEADVDHLQAVLDRSTQLADAIWSVVERAAAGAGNPAVLSAVIASANEVIDLGEMRLSSLENYVRAPIILLLVGVAAVALAFLGWSFGAADRRGTVEMMLLSALLTVVLTVIVDINRPQRGWIRVGDASLTRARRSMQ